MATLRFVHTADLHLDSPFVGVSRLSPQAADALVEASFSAFDRVVELCLREQVDALLVAGDVFDRNEHSPRAEWRFHRGLEALADANISSFVVHGNHDALSGPPPTTVVREGVGVHVFGSDLTSAPILRDGEEIARVFGVSYDRRDVMENLAQRFARDPDTPFAIGLLHANVGGRPEHESYAPCTVEDLVAAGMDYWALGHVHEREILRDEPPVIAYPGNPQGRSRREPGPRSCYLVTVDTTGPGRGRSRRRMARVAVDTVETDGVRWETVEVSIEGIEDKYRLGVALEEAMRGAVAASGDRSLLLRLIVTGRGALHREVAQPGAVRGIVEELEREITAPGRFVLVEWIEVRTRPPVDRERLIGEPSLVGEVHRIARRVTGSAPDVNEVRGHLEEVAARLREARVPYDTTPEMLDDRIDRAVSLVTDLLEEGGG